MGTFANAIIIVSFLIIVGLAIMAACLVPYEKAGGIQICNPGYSLVNGECKGNQYTPCNITSDCVPNLVCINGVCNNAAIQPSDPAPTIDVISNPSPDPSPAPPVKIFNKVKVITYSDLTDDDPTSYAPDFRFDVRSGVSTEVEQISTPYQEKEVEFICRSARGSEVIDACTYSDHVIFVRKDDIVLENRNGIRKISHCDLKIDMIVVVGGYLYCLAGKNLYRCADPFEQRWRLEKVTYQHLPNEILYINAPHDGKHLIVQDSNNGAIFDGDGKFVSGYNCRDERRVYAKDIYRYAVFNQKDKTARIYPTNEIYRNITDIAFGYHGEIYTLKPDHECHRIAFVDWKPYLLC